MAFSKRLPSLAVGAATAVIAALAFGAPAPGQTPTPGIVASDFAFAAAGGGAPSVTIATGGDVTFEYPSGMSRHDVVFTGIQPRMCLVTGPSGIQVSDPVAPVPDYPFPAPWQGRCTFERAGTYPFVCGLHPEMTGSITVVDPPGGPPPPRPTTLELLDIPGASSLRVARIQRGSGVRASLIVARAGSRLLVRAFARRSALAAGRSTRQVEVGRRLLAPVHGRVTFSVALSAAARGALRRSGRLGISLRIAVTPPSGRAYAATRAVTMRRGAAR